MTAPIRMLLVEDNDDDAQLLLVRLRRAGYTPDYIRVDNADSLKQALQDHDWQIVVSDYAMPGFSGLEALRILREHNRNTPFILVSGTVGEEIAVEAMRLGANDYIMKDNLTRLVPAIDRELRDVRDRSDRKRAEEALYQERERALVTLHSIGDGVITTDADGRVDYMNPVAERVTGWSSNEAQGHPLMEVLPLTNEATRISIESPASISLRTRQVVSLSEQCLLVNRDGQEFHIEDSAAPIFDRDNRVIGVVLVFHDVTRERRMARQMTWEATHDSLTGLVNRREFAERLNNLLASSEQEHALLYLDLDQFKVINDTCGHDAGDELLRQLSRLLLQNVPTNSSLARLGGDEFGVLLENVSMEQAREVANQLLTTFSHFTYQWEERRFDIGVSIGMVPIQRDTRNASLILSAADVACYVAKESGRNRIHVYEESDIDLGQRHNEMHWVSRITEALEEDRFVLYRQEITSLDEMETTPHYELLVRMRSVDGTIIPPGNFIPAAERYNLMNSLDRWVIDKAFQQLKLFQQQGDEGIYSINLSGNSLNDENFSEYIVQKIREYRIRTELLCFEVTETAAVFNLARASHIIKTLKKLGCRFSLDDFGSGLSSFGYLKNLPVDFLKIDGSFVKDMDTNPMNRAIVEAIHQVGHALSIRTIAEFVENEAIVRQLRDIGVDYAQGYYFSRPEPLVDDNNVVPIGKSSLSSNN
ncbi:PAS domain S-box-containing protein/diguanylate cyclase (GGDEF)-like protein [Thiogranum longum]|uniref:PAS domain S-box-containing protein/diguanylate cyclase (GGDEF)-like protein n=1 Tax=Thiogranum longum TaxID=1537524 RepID=A0A4R1HBR6_9GAMM|nr:GGDEF domain-containing response regulator [Thiogranum longum]TCK19427.1 PAS domain S-box-containing protein/diguanylate cyclase (GGDEF)-like protein [Thiogranum longum]